MQRDFQSPQQFGREHIACAARQFRGAPKASVHSPINPRDIDLRVHNPLLDHSSTLVQCALDLGGRPYYRGPLPSRLYDHWMRSFADNARATLHLRVLRGEDRHHIIEAAFKALGLTIREALVESGAVFSTKGATRLRVDQC